jgi:hypothetical protein
MSLASLLSKAVRRSRSLLVLLTLGACSSPGPYGYAQLYSPLDAEEAATKDSVPYDPSAARRKPDTWKGRLVSTFGVVTEVKAGPDDGTRRVSLSIRGLQPRNLCAGPDSDTCRVTVTDTEFSVLWAVVPLEAVKPVATPPDPIQRGSLLRVVGTFVPSKDASEPPTIDVRFARHWPYQTYVTTGARESMRR